MNKLFIPLAALGLALCAACGPVETERPVSAPNTSSAPIESFSSNSLEEAGEPVPSEVIPPAAAPEPEGEPVDGPEPGDDPEPRDEPAPVDVLEPEAASPNQPDVLVEIGLFDGETVLSIYSLDYANRSYHRVPASDAADILAGLNTLSAQSPEGGGGDTGFLVFTESGKHAVYFSASDTGDSERGRLRAASLRVNGATPHLIQWFCYMSAENIQSIQFGGAANIRVGSTEPAVAVSVNTTDRDSIAAIDRFLKAFEVKPGARIATGESDKNNPVTTADLYHLTIQFQSGVQYTVFGNEGYLTIHSSDMPEQITYSCEDDELRSFMKSLPEAETMPW